MCDLRWFLLKSISISLTTGHTEPKHLAFEAADDGDEDFNMGVTCDAVSFKLWSKELTLS